ncbi:hypothetical protein VFPBJ_03534 [Purpureocillium lilacinum]|uniref:Uncharacterized protein n=1 Tax=Purpureocillium lilacinum TaxID=33203 RepID=A0A179H3G5_PURLI|nr:hypothetical protein VFPBJ_03534 [Purpureocillium lilacinum]
MPDAEDSSASTSISSRLVGMVSMSCGLVSDPPTPLPFGGHARPRASPPCEQDSRLPNATPAPLLAQTERRQRARGHGNPLPTATPGFYNRIRHLYRARCLSLDHGDDDSPAEIAEELEGLSSAAASTSRDRQLSSEAQMDDVIAGERFTALDGGAWDPSIGLHCSPICTFIHGRYPHEYRHTCTTPNRKAAIVHPIAGEHVSRPQCINSCRDADACSSSPVRLGRSWRAHQSTASAHARHASAGQPATGQVARRPPLIAAGQRGASASPAWLCFTVEAQLPDQPSPSAGREPWTPGDSIPRRTSATVDASTATSSRSPERSPRLTRRQARAGAGAGSPKKDHGHGPWIQQQPAEPTHPPKTRPDDHLDTGRQPMAWLSSPHRQAVATVRAPAAQSGCADVTPKGGPSGPPPPARFASLTPRACAWTVTSPNGRTTPIASRRCLPVIATLGAPSNAFSPHSLCPAPRARPTSVGPAAMACYARTPPSAPSRSCRASAHTHTPPFPVARRQAGRRPVPVPKYYFSSSLHVARDSASPLQLSRPQRRLTVQFVFLDFANNPEQRSHSPGEASLPHSSSTTPSVRRSVVSPP